MGNKLHLYPDLTDAESPIVWIGYELLAELD